ncbi:MAG: Cytochrome, partial [Pseudomonadota bacterium]
LLAACAREAPQATAPMVLPPGQGWTGLTRPREMIAARLELMEHMEELMKPIDTLQVEDVHDAATLKFNAEVVGAILTAVPHLFPPTTNLYDPKATIPDTLALPQIWQQFDTFYSMAEAAAQQAEAMASAEGMLVQRAQSLKLRGTCDACHELFLRKYVSPVTQPSDYEFDFSSALPAKAPK